MDGQVIESAMASDTDVEQLAVWALGLYMNTEHVVQKLGNKRIHQTLCLTDQGYVLVSDCGLGVLVQFADSAWRKRLLEIITRTSELLC